MKLPSEVRRLPNWFLHKDLPIFKDSQDELYLSPEYQTQFHGILKDLGVCDLNLAEVLSRIEADLVSSESRIRTYAPDGTWHQACASLISLCYKTAKPNPVSLRRVKRLSIIPINNGKSWTGAPGVGIGGIKSIYFPTTEGIEIPQQIGMHLIDFAAVALPQRKELFQLLGAYECSKEEVISQIEACHRGQTRLRELSLKDHCAEFRYLFRFHPKAESISHWIRVPVEPAGYMRTDDPLYFPSQGEFDTYNLLPAEFRAQAHSNVANFIHKGLIEAEEPNAYFQGKFWKDWLQTVTRARYHPPVLQNRYLFGSPTISKTMLAVLTNNPQKFVGMLRAHWNDYKVEAGIANQQIRSLSVPCTNRTSHPFEDCYMPTDELQAQLQFFGTKDCVPLLQLPSAWNEDSKHEWDFLEQIGVRTKPDLKFYGEINCKLVTRDLQDWNGVATSPKDTFIALYTHIAGLATANDSDFLRYACAQIYVYPLISIERNST